MNWRDQLIDRLAEHPLCGYAADQSPATEPAALAALALLAHGRIEPAEEVGDSLAIWQAKDGSVGVGPDAATPRWPTSLAVLTWLALLNRSAKHAKKYQPHVDQAVRWILAIEGKTQARGGAMGHNTTLVAWPWAEGTHSWIEPTSLHLMALQAAGHGQHSRCREAARMLLDRQLDQGGCNYGNTQVLGQTLRPHVQPTGLAMMALAHEKNGAGRIQRSLDYLTRALSASTTTSSLCWALMGLAAHGRTIREAGDWLEAASRRVQRRNGSPYQFALLLLADLGTRSELLFSPRSHSAITNG